MAATAPTQGRATVFETMNVHTAANRQSPSFFQIAPNQQVDVIAHERAARVPLQPPEFEDAIVLTETLRKARRAERASHASEAPPPPPPAPRVPDNWMALSGHPGGIVPPPSAVAPKTAPATAAAAPEDEWTLIRAAGGRAGWVLSRMLLMAIPDDVAQYAERARITAYFQIGSSHSHGESKPVWLWAALAEAGAPYDFDSLRIFAWNFRRHRYETSFIERGLRGHLPIRLFAGAGGDAARFQVVVEEKTGVVERSYTLQNFRARVTARPPAALPPSWLPAETSVGTRPARPAPPAPVGFKDRVRSGFKGMLGAFRR
jgi:hypothetical protein